MLEKFYWDKLVNLTLLVLLLARTIYIKRKIFQAFT
jgi:hypothetical protein